MAHLSFEVSFDSSDLNFWPNSRSVIIFGFLLLKNKKIPMVKSDIVIMLRMLEV